MATTCEKSSRVTRGGAGLAIGALLGSLVGLGSWMAVRAAVGTDPDTQWANIFAPVTGAVVGAGVGVYIGARKPQCE